MKTFLLAFIIGIASAFGFAPFNFPPVLVAGYAWLFHQLAREQTTPKQAFRLSFFFGFGQLLFGLYWIGESTLIDFATWWWAWPITTVGVPIFHGLYFALAGYATVKFNGPRLPAAALFFALEELARAVLLTGFPWNLAGTTWISVPWIAQNADWAGVWGLTCLTLALAALLARPRRIFPVSLAAACLCAMTLYGVITRQPTTYNNDVAVRIIQPNIPQGDKWRDDLVFSNSLLPLEMTGEPPLDSSAKEHWIIWPETAQASTIWNGPQFGRFYKSMLGAWPENTFLYTGILSLDPDNFANMIVGATPAGDLLWTQAKHHLVPFGEYMPYDEIFKIGPIVGIDGFKIGPPPATQTGGILPLICYEIIFPDLARKALTADTRAIITVTDDSWFGTWSGPRQHLVQVQWRAIETGLPILRSANTGISAIIDSYGRILDQTQLNERKVIDGVLPARRPSTPFTDMGNWPILLYLMFCAVLLVLGKKRKLFY